uniref:Uncharacterized protein n=1 Tax=Dulem virus 35 TaxID=3145753 RepID=A0AAU8B0J4_9CAUD
MRKLRRMVAKYNMKKSGIHKPFQDKRYGSYFSRFWRQYV